MSFQGAAKTVAVYGPKVIKAGKMAGKLIPGVAEVIGWADFAGDVASAVYDWATPQTDPATPGPPAGGASQSGGDGFQTSDRAIITNIEGMAQELVQDVGDPTDAVNAPSLFGRLLVMSIKATTINNTQLASSQALGAFTLDAAGRAAFDAEVAAGHIIGSGLFVVRLWNTGAELLPVPALNPYHLTFTSPSGDEVYSTLDYIADVLNNASIWPGVLIP